MKEFVSTRLLSGIIVLSTILSGCSTPPLPKKVTMSERVQFDRAIGLELAEQFEPELTLRRDPAVTSYLRKIGQALADGTPDLHLPSVDVSLIADPRRRWSTYSLPGGKIYVSTGLLKPMEFENEVAAVLAFELGHLEEEHALDYLRKNYSSMVSPDSLLLPGTSHAVASRVDYLGSKGLFDFTEKQDIEAARAAVDILYAAGFDPRGLVTIWERHQASPGRSPYSPATIEKLLDATRTAIALHSPLRNPIVRTQAFMEIRKRFQKL